MSPGKKKQPSITQSESVNRWSRLANLLTHVSVPPPPQQGRFLWGPVPLSLTQIGNVTHLWEAEKTKNRAAELAVTPPAVRPRLQQDPGGDFDTEGE